LKNDICSNIYEKNKINMFYCVSIATYHISKSIDSDLQLACCIANMLEQKNLKHSFKAMKPTFDHDLNLSKPGHKWFGKKNTEIDKNLSILSNKKRFQENEKYRLEYYSKEEDDFLNLWISTYNGLVRYNLNTGEFFANTAFVLFSNTF
jgi:hypothetical protein